MRNQQSKFAKKVEEVVTKNEGLQKSKDNSISLKENPQVICE